MRRAWAAGAVALIAAGLLAGCSLPNLQLIAVYNGADGKPWVAMTPCGRDRITSAHVSSWPAATGPAPTDQKFGWSAWATGPTAAGGSFPLFEPPVSWHAKHGGGQRVLPGYTYRVEFRSYDDDGLLGGVYHGHVRFTAEDLAGLEPGEMWAGGRAMSPKKFMELVADEC